MKTLNLDSEFKSNFKKIVKHHKDDIVSFTLIIVIIGCLVTGNKYSGYLMSEIGLVWIVGTAILSSAVLILSGIAVLIWFCWLASSSYRTKRNLAKKQIIDRWFSSIFEELR